MGQGGQNYKKRFFFHFPYNIVGELTKVRNNLKEFCPTEALYIGQYQTTWCLFSVGSDVDSGDSYINSKYTFKV